MAETYQFTIGRLLALATWCAVALASLTAVVRHGLQQPAVGLFGLVIGVAASGAAAGALSRKSIRCTLVAVSCLLLVVIVLLLLPAEA